MLSGIDPKGASIPWPGKLPLRPETAAPRNSRLVISRAAPCDDFFSRQGNQTISVPSLPAEGERGVRDGWYDPQQDLLWFANYPPAPALDLQCNVLFGVSGNCWATFSKHPATQRAITISYRFARA